MQTPNLNLARKWRPKTFDTIVGQDVPVKMLKNGLYLNKFFPVYLFAGQRGCGKTSTARVFAAALNCHRLQDFQKDPQSQPLPCMTCDSCLAMTRGDHPDFIEIDAASHTGVDNVRQIIESSSYMPLAGRKKIYLIDEAHMLSKAAFNAFLKILEEPPTSVTFILATTEIPKIPTTVLSRCFQLIFGPIQAEPLKQHLLEICNREDVVIEDGALDLLIEETEGSARDAINLLERVRFSSQSITEQAVLHILGKMSSKELIELFDIVLKQDPVALINHLQEIQFQQRNPLFLWDMIIGLCRALVWTKYGIEQLPDTSVKHRDDLKKLAGQCSINRINALFQLLWNQEELFLKTTKKHIFLEMVLLQMCQQVDVTDLKDLLDTIKHDKGPITSKTQEPSIRIKPVTQPTPKIISTKEPANPIPDAQTAPASSSDSWKAFLQELSPLADPMLNSIFRQAHYVGKNDQERAIIIQLATLNPFFTDKIDETKNIWEPLLAKYFEGYTRFKLTKQEQTAHNAIKTPSEAIKVTPKAPAGSYPEQRKKVPLQAPNAAHRAKTDSYLTISSPDEWPVSSLLLRHFPGKIRKIGPIETKPDSDSPVVVNQEEISA